MGIKANLVLLFPCFLGSLMATTSGFVIHQHRAMNEMPLAGIGRVSLQMMAHQSSAQPSNERNKMTQIDASSLSIPEHRRRPLHARAKQWIQSSICKLRTMDEVSKWRLAAVTFISSIVLNRPWIDANLVKLWEYLQHSSALLPRMFRHDHWEWMLAITAFSVWIHGFWLADRAVLKAAQKGKVHPWRKFRLQDRFEAQKFRRAQLKKQERDPNYVVMKEPPLITHQTKWNKQAWIFEFWVYAAPLWLWDYFIPRRAAKIATWGAPTAFQICRDVTCGLLLYDLAFFVGHFLMHKIPFIYQFVHSKHHRNPEVRAGEIVRLSLFEEVYEVGISILALNYLGAHPISRTIYNCIITFLLTELHCGFDFPWTPQNVIPFGFATGSRRHHYHHRFGRHYYQKFFYHVDRLFGFYQKNDGTLLAESVKEFEDPPKSWVK